MNKYGNRPGIRYTKNNRILHIVFGRYHILVGRDVLIVRNTEMLTSKALWGWR